MKIYNQSQSYFSDSSTGYSSTMLEDSDKEKRRKRNEVEFCKFLSLRNLKISLIFRILENVATKRKPLKMK